jgi:hypothetical protein
MGSPPPNIPEFPAETARIDWDRMAATVLNAVMNSSLPEWARKAAEDIVPAVFAAWWGFLIRSQGTLGKLIGDTLQKIEEEAGPHLLQMATYGLNDLFGTNLSAGDLGLRGGTAARRAAADRIGEAVMAAMFGSFETGAALTPEQGRENAERMLSFNLQLALEGWMTGVLGTGMLTKFFPNWGDLDDIVAANLGLGRVSRRVLAPMINAMIVEPFTRDINKRFAPATYNETQAVRALNRGAIGEDDYFAVMAELGWTRERAATLRSLNSVWPSKEDIRAMLELSEIDDAQAVELLRGLGYQPEMADTLVRMFRNDRVRTIRQQSVQVARDMFRDREITLTQFRAVMSEAGVSELEERLLVSVAEMERARPARLPRGEMEEAFKLGFVDLGRLRRYYTEEGYAFDDLILLEQMAIRAKLAHDEAQRERDEAPGAARVATIPRATWEELFRRGIIPAARLVAAYEAAGFPAEQVALLLRRAELDKAEDEARAAAKQARELAPPAAELPRATWEELHRQGAVPLARLREFYEGAGFDGEEIALLLARAAAAREAEEAAEQERTERERAARTQQIPRSAWEELHRRGLVDGARLRAFYEAAGFPAEEAGALLRLADQRRAEYLARAAEREAPEPGEPRRELPRSSAEQAFEAGLLSDTELLAYYASVGFAPEDADLLLALAAGLREERAERAAAQAAAGALKSLASS